MKYKTTTVFIASSIVEFEYERDVIENYLWEQNGNGEPTVIPLRCENVDPAMSVTRKEDDFCNYIAQSNICLFILGSNIGKYTQEEYEYAKKLKTNGKQVQIVAFCKGNKMNPFYKQIAKDNVESYDYCDIQSLYKLLDQRLLFNKKPKSYIVTENSVNIFLASSIKDDKQQEMRIKNFIWRMNYEFSKKYNLSILPLVNIEQSKNELENIINKSAMCFFIVFGKVSDDVVNELKTAKRKLDKVGHPRIYIYFKKIISNEEESVIQFKKYLDLELKHFYGSFDDLDTVKLRILLNLAILKAGSQEISFKDGKCYLGDDFALNVKNVAEFANNKKLAEIKNLLLRATERRNDLKAAYEKDPSNNEICAEYIKITGEYENIKKEVENIENSIFSVSLSMSQDESLGAITDRQKRAYELFVNGEVEKAINLLDIDESINNYERIANYAKQSACNVIAEGRQKIYFLHTMLRYDERDKIISETYEKLLPIATSQQIELGIFNEYALFLKYCDRHADALKYALKLQSIYSVFPPQNALDNAENLTLLAMIYADLSDRQQDTIECSLHAIEIRESAITECGYSEANYIGLARVYNAIGKLYRKANMPTDAERCIERAKYLFDELEKHTDKFVVEQAETFITRGIIYSEQYETDKAFEEFSKAIKVLDKYPSDDLHTIYVKSSAYQNQASLSKKDGLLPDAIKLFEKALEIRKELCNCNPARYIPTLAFTYQGIGNAYRAIGNKFNKACEYFLLAYDMRQKICLVNRAAHEVELSDSCIKLAGTLLDMQRPDDAYKYLKEGYNIRRPLYEKSPKTYERWYAQTLFEYGRYNQQKGDINTAESYYDQAFALRVKISEENLQPNVEGLYDSFTKMRQLYGEEFKKRLSERESKLYDKLYSFSQTKNKTDKCVQFVKSYTGI